MECITHSEDFRRGNNLHSSPVLTRLAMHTIPLLTAGSISIIKGLRTGFAKTKHSWLLVRGAFAIAIIASVIAIISATMLPNDLIALKIEPPVINSSLQPNVDTRLEVQIAQM